MDLLKELETGRDKFKYEVSFRGRGIGRSTNAIDTSGVVEMDEASDDEQILAKVKETHENITHFRTKRLWNCGYKNCQDRTRSLCALCYE
jgi:hypothetical protein